MGAVDWVRWQCPKCHKENNYTTKAGNCDCGTYRIAEQMTPDEAQVVNNDILLCKHCDSCFKVKAELPETVSVKLIEISI